MDAESRETRVTEIMSEIVNALSQRGPLSLSSMSEPYRSDGEMGVCLMAFSRLEAEGLIAQRSDGKWELAGEG